MAGSGRRLRDDGAGDRPAPILPRFIRVKRSAADAELPRLLCDVVDEPVFYHRLGDDEDPPEQRPSSSPSPHLVQNLLLDLKSGVIKRTKVHASPSWPGLASLSLGHPSTETTAVHDEEDSYVYYVRRDLKTIDPALLEDPLAVGLVSLNDLVFDNSHPDSDDEERWEDEDDSNAENYYRNDYPDEEDFFDSDGPEQSEEQEGAGDYYRDECGWLASDEDGEDVCPGHRWSFGMDESDADADVDVDAYADVDVDADADAASDS